jgi:nucleoside-diphosphate-sugar epimerase
MIFLTGGSGFIGSHFSKILPGDQFMNFDLKEPSGYYKLSFKGDVRVYSDIAKSIDGRTIDCVISLAAKHHDFGIGHDEYFDTNEEGTRVICKIAGERGIKKIIFFSSVAVYGVREQVSFEDLEPKPDGPYGASKLAGEQVLADWAAMDASRSVLIIRPTLVYGANNRANMFNLIRQIDSGLYFHLGKADNIKSIAYVENLVQATIWLMDCMKPGVSIFNYSDEPQLTSRQIADIIARSLGKKIRFTVPKPVGLLAGIPFDLAIKVTGKNLPISTARIRKLGTSTHHSAKKLFDEGFKPTFSTIEGLEKMVDWYLQEKGR